MRPFPTSEIAEAAEAVKDTAAAAKAEVSDITAAPQAEATEAATAALQAADTEAATAAPQAADTKAEIPEAVPEAPKPKRGTRRRRAYRCLLPDAV